MSSVLSPLVALLNANETQVTGINKHMFTMCSTLKSMKKERAHTDECVHKCVEEFIKTVIKNEKHVNVVIKHLHNGDVFNDWSRKQFRSTTPDGSQTSHVGTLGPGLLLGIKQLGAGGRWTIQIGRSWILFF